ncbi:hypothetical protein FCM35_KLT07797 [Carex littledalei]|uniref:Uncharacterized protein n=1 Tax=Carex littledalei TaxID=544730 RepID=A0A833R0D9_9POAL|nr:hypothetical protein FCM35_KLT07797 [Carex littledalei]
MERNTRGPMTCGKLDRLLKKDVPTGLEFDDYGRGKGQKEWSSYVCLQARRQINITHETWKHVPDREKDNVWLDIRGKGYGDETDECDMELLQDGAGKSHVNKGEIPFDEYLWIEAEDWDEFVRMKTSEAFRI